MATLRVAPTQLKSPWCLKRRGQRTGVKWNLRLQQPQAPSTAAALKTHAYQMTAADSDSNTKTVVRAPSNLALDSTAVSREL